YAHQGIELKPIPGIAPKPAPSAVPRQQVAAAQGADAPPLRPTVLTERGTAVLIQIEHLMEEAGRALAPPPSETSALPAGAASDASPQSEAFATASRSAARENETATAR